MGDMDTSVFLSNLLLGFVGYDYNSRNIKMKIKFVVTLLLMAYVGSLAALFTFSMIFGWIGG